MAPTPEAVLGEGGVAGAGVRPAGCLGKAPGHVSNAMMPGRVHLSCVPGDVCPQRLVSEEGYWGYLLQKPVCGLGDLKVSTQSPRTWALFIRCQRQCGPVGTFLLFAPQCPHL